MNYSAEAVNTQWPTSARLSVYLIQEGISETSERRASISRKSAGKEYTEADTRFIGLRRRIKYERNENRLEVMTITTKYNIGDVVWVSVYGEPLEVRILGVMYEQYPKHRERITYRILEVDIDDPFASVTIPENNIWGSKEELLKELTL